MSDRLTVWLSDLQPLRHPAIFESLSGELENHGIPFQLLKNTRDIWVRDFLPVSDGAGGFVQFRFNPGYLRSKKYDHIRTIPDLLREQLGIQPAFSDLIIDGGNIVRFGKTAIVTDIVMKDNPGRTERQIREELCSKLNISRLIIIPRQPFDFTGHADGMVRFVDEDSVLVNDYSREKKYFGDRILKTLKNGGLNYHPFIYAADYSSTDTVSAVGTYINFLQVDRLIFFPSFGLPEDKEAEKEIRRFFPEYEVTNVESRSLAEEGGVLNCVGWVRE